MADLEQVYDAERGVWLSPNELTRRADGWTLGLGVFTTGLLHRGRLCHARAHVERLQSSCAAFGWSPSVAIEAAVEHLERLVEGLKEDHRLRIRIVGQRSAVAEAEVSIELSALDAPSHKRLPWTLTMGSGSSFIRPAANATSRHKTLNYLDQVLAWRSAEALGYRDAVLLNEHERVACAAMGNLAALLEGVWRTPPVCEGALPGILRSRWLVEAEAITGFPAGEGVLRKHELSQAQALVYSNSLRGVRSVERLDERREWAWQPTAAQAKQMFDLRYGELGAEDDGPSTGSIPA